MSGSAHNGEDDIAFFAADIGHTYVLPLTTGLTTLPAALGALVPGRYLIQVGGLSAGAVAWLHFDKYQDDPPNIPTPIGAGPQRIPILLSAVIAIETHAVKGYSDRLSGILTTGTATLYATRVSRDA